jgi:hypothetical protein
VAQGLGLHHKHQVLHDKTPQWLHIGSIEESLIIMIKRPTPSVDEIDRWSSITPHNQKDGMPPTASRTSKRTERVYYPLPKILSPSDTPSLALCTSPASQTSRILLTFPTHRTPPLRPCLRPAPLAAAFTWAGKGFGGKPPTFPVQCLMCTR